MVTSLFKNLSVKPKRIDKGNAIEWLVLQTDNDLDDKILAKVKSGMKLGVV